MKRKTKAAVIATAVIAVIAAVMKVNPSFHIYPNRPAETPAPKKPTTTTPSTVKSQPINSAQVSRPSRHFHTSTIAHSPQNKPNATPAKTLQATPKPKQDSSDSSDSESSSSDDMANEKPKQTKTPTKPNPITPKKDAKKVSADKMDVDGDDATSDVMDSEDSEDDPDSDELGSSEAEEPHADDDDGDASRKKVPLTEEELKAKKEALKERKKTKLKEKKREKEMEEAEVRLQEKQALAKQKRPPIVDIRNFTKTQIIQAYADTGRSEEIWMKFR